MKKIRVAVPMLVVAGLVGTLVWQANGKRDNAPAGTLAGNGTIEATEVDVSAKVAGKLVSLTVKEGDAVKANQPIARLDSGELDGQVTQAMGNLQAAEAVLAELQAGTRPEDIRRARAQYQAAQQALQQAEARRDLVDAGPRAEQLAQLRAACRQTEAQLALVKAGARKEQVAQLRAAYEQAQASYALVQAGPRPETIAQLSAMKDQADANLQDAETELARVERLLKDGAVAVRVVDQARTRRNVAQAQVRGAAEKLQEAKNGARPEEIAAAADAVEVARQRLAEAEAGPRPQEVAMAEQAAEMARQKLDEAQAGARPQERREAEAAVAAAKAQVEAARAALDLAQQGPRPETIAAARARVEQARGVLSTATASQGQTDIVSPVSGRVTLRNVEPGELVTPGLPIIRVAELDEVWLRVYVPEPQKGLVKIGQRAEVTTDTYPHKRYRGRVIEIAEEPEFTPRNVQTKGERVKMVFGVKIAIANPDQELKAGMPADAVLHVGAR